MGMHEVKCRKDGFTAGWVGYRPQFGTVSVRQWAQQTKKCPSDLSLGNDQPKWIVWRKHRKGGVGMEFLIGVYIVCKVFWDWMKKYK